LKIHGETKIVTPPAGCFISGILYQVILLASSCGYVNQQQVAGIISYMNNSGI